MPVDPVAAAAEPSTAASVRPPDLAPESVRGQDRDVLAGWDADAGVAELTRWQTDRRPFPTDTVIVAGAGLAGALVGATRARRGRGAARGLVAGVVAAAVARRIWRLQA
ncbi:hypothetical protein [Egicoccus sp. AB-alg2]|uniref:hypothetical protein n=1 Tax=Egicoccus sp. AB-alg2 TaxID=3242693 RepID=UPI00359DE099